MNSLFPQINDVAQIEVNLLSLSRGEKRLIEDLTVTLSSGDILWAQGDNGIGKTTLLEALAGLRRPDNGSITWHKNGNAVSPSKLAAYQPHRSYAKPVLSAVEDLNFWAGLSKTKDLVEETIEHVGLLGRAKIAAHDLSAGQKRRLALAKLILSQKPVWIMDEPAAAMDKSGVDLIDDLIQKHISRGGIAIIASHDAARDLSAHTRKLTLKAAA